MRKNSLNRFRICFKFGCNWLGSSGNYMTNSVRQSHSDCRLTKFSLMLLQMQISFPKRLPLSRRVLIVNPLKWSSLAESISNSLSLNKFVDYTWAKFRKIRAQSIGYKKWWHLCYCFSLCKSKLSKKNKREG